MNFMQVLPAVSYLSKQDTFVDHSGAKLLAVVREDVNREVQEGVQRSQSGSRPFDSASNERQS